MLNCVSLLWSVTVKGTLMKVNVKCCLHFNLQVVGWILIEVVAGFTHHLCVNNYSPQSFAPRTGKIERKRKKSSLSLGLACQCAACQKQWPLTPAPNTTICYAFITWPCFVFGENRLNSEKSLPSVYVNGLYPLPTVPTLHNSTHSSTNDPDTASECEITTILT